MPNAVTSTERIVVTALLASWILTVHDESPNIGVLTHEGSTFRALAATRSFRRGGVHSSVLCGACAPRQLSWLADGRDVKRDEHTDSPKFPSG